MWALGGFGIWTATEKSNTADAFDEQQSTFDHERHADNDLARWGPLAGFATSSTRNELAAAIMGLLMPRPVHIGSDSKTFVDKANFLKKHARHWTISYGTEHHRTRNPCKRPWAMQVDGDLWQSCWQAMVTRGPHSARFTWVKGHATANDIEKGISNAILKYGNDQSDRAATEGTAAHQPGMLALCRWTATKHANYVEFMHRIHRFIVKMCKAEKRARSELQPKDLNGKLVVTKMNITKPLYYDDTHNEITIELNECPKGTHQFSYCQEKLETIHQFIRNLKWSVPKEDTGERSTHGISWIELLVMYEMLGYDPALCKAKHRTGKEGTKRDRERFHRWRLFNAGRKKSQSPVFWKEQPLR